MSRRAIAALGTVLLLLGVGRARAEEPPRNPFGLPDVVDPQGEDILRFAKEAAPAGDPDDPNAEDWPPEESDVTEGSLDGDWFGRWGTHVGSVKVAQVGDRVYVLYTGSQESGGRRPRYLLEAQRTGARLSGRWVDVDKPAETGLYAGVVVNDDRIDGTWGGEGRWDFRRRGRHARALLIEGLRWVRGRSREHAQVRDGVLRAAPGDAPDDVFLYSEQTKRELDARVQVSRGAADGTTGALAGIVFWATGEEDYFVFALDDAGQASVLRRIGPLRIDTVVPPRRIGEGRFKVNGWNELRVVTHGNRATAAVDGVEWATFWGQPPLEGSQAGLYVGNGRVEGTRGEFKDLLFETWGPTPSLGVGASLIDDFATADPTWGVTPDGPAEIRDRSLVLTPGEGRLYQQLQSSVLVSWTWAHVKVRARLPNGATGADGVGLVYGGLDATNSYHMTLRGGGTVSVERWNGESLETVVEAVRIPDSAKFDPTGWNQIHVEAKGDHVTGSVNGVPVISYDGEAPRGPYRTGVVALSSAAGHTFSFTHFEIR